MRHRHDKIFIELSNNIYLIIIYFLTSGNPKSQKIAPDFQSHAPAFGTSFSTAIAPCHKWLSPPDFQFRFPKLPEALSDRLGKSSQFVDGMSEPTVE